mmetsp:Transcript_16188/g.54235  ORF Transcript_16188/g.54235 Transcript_16188/m.54235 type:complete len:111 (+) Transcript_16188:1000-1332(+)
MVKISPSCSSQYWRSSQLLLPRPAHSPDGIKFIERLRERLLPVSRPCEFHQHMEDDVDVENVSAALGGGQTRKKEGKEGEVEKRREREEREGQSQHLHISRDILVDRQPG